MPDWTTLDNLYLIISLLAPGLIVLFVRSQFVTGRIASNLGVVPYVDASAPLHAFASAAVVLGCSAGGFWTGRCPTRTFASRRRCSRGLGRCICPIDPAAEVAGTRDSGA